MDLAGAIAIAILATALHLYQLPTVMEYH